MGLILDRVKALLHIYLLEIYDQVWFSRSKKHYTNEEGMVVGHSKEAFELVKEIIAELEQIPNVDSDMFPFDTIDEIKKEYLNWMEKYNVTF